MHTRSEKRRTVQRVGVAALAALVAVGCAGGGTGDAPGSSMAGARLCGDASLSPQTRAALELITGSKQADLGDDGLTVASAVEEVSAKRQHTLRGFGDVCHIYASPASGAERLKVSWNLTPKPKSAPAPKFTRLSMGERAGAAWDMGYVTLACAYADGAPGVSPDYVSVWVESMTGVLEQERDTKALRNAYATVAHAFALAMAKGLGCADKAGLPAEPVLIP